MIHHTLLPKDESRSLRREYRTRVFIIVAFFISCSIVIGILVLIPSYILSSYRKEDTLGRARELEKSKIESGALDLEKELSRAYNIAEKIISLEDSITYSEMIQKILLHKSKDIYISSFEMSHAEGTSTPIGIIIQGKATKRESLVSFKKSLESDKYFLKVELPISDLAKGKDTSFALRLDVKR